ncbi:MAG TPA: TIGR02147 family protein [Myxococcota bacterium]|nr:TIGR02147 family protein [Myxococcota bacterium]
MTTESAASRPSPFAFDDFRAYLKAMFEHLKLTQRRFSYRYFAAQAGYASPNFLKLVIDGKRNLTMDSVNRFATALQLSPQERDAFEALVLLGQARTDEDRNRYYARLRRPDRPRNATQELQRAQYEVYSLWYALPIRELMLMPGFVDDPIWISKRLRPRVRPADVKKALDLLEATGLAVRDTDGRLAPHEPKLSAQPSVPSLAIRNYHRAMLQLSAQALDTMPPSERNLSSVTIRLSREQYAAACAQIAEFRQRLLDTFEEAPNQGAPQDVYVLGFQVVPVSQESES